MQVYEVFINNEYIDTIMVNYPSLSRFQSFLKDHRYGFKDNDVPLVDTKGNWFLENLKYCFRLMN